MKIGDLPFVERDPLELLNLHIDRDEPDPDFTGFGYGRLALVHLDERARGRRIDVRDALIVALHCTEVGPIHPDDVELEFFLDAAAVGPSVTAPLSAFLDVWLPRIRGGERAVVLTLCNPHGAVIRGPASLGPRPLFYALGDVESWLDPDDGVVPRLVADRWRTVPTVPTVGRGQR